MATNAAAHRLDSDGDGYDDGAPQMPSEPAPAPDPTIPSPAPAPVQLTINIVGTFGTGAFATESTQAAAGNTIVWTNSDVIAHAIVLDDGTPVGSLSPGQTSNPVTVTLRSRATTACCIHRWWDRCRPCRLIRPSRPIRRKYPGRIREQHRRLRIRTKPYPDYEDDYYYLRATQ